MKPDKKLNRDEALKELKVRISDENIIKHSLAVEVIMKELAIHFKEDPENWGLAGLLHDLDYEKTRNNPEKHSKVSSEILEDMGVDDSVVYAVKAHNPLHGIKRKRKMDKLLFAADPISDLIIDSVLMLPSKKISDLNVSSLIKRYNEKDFSKRSVRDQIKECEEVGLKIEMFFEISLKAMRKIGKELDF